MHFKPVKAFISYAAPDEHHFKALKSHMAGLNGRVELWREKDLLAGDPRGEVLRRLEEASLILLLVSADFFYDESCSAHQSRALERHHAGTARVVPIIVRECDWRASPIGSLTALPPGATPIASAPTDEAWTNVVTEIRRMVESMSDSAASPQDTGASKPVRAVMEPPREPTKFMRDWRCSMMVMAVAVTAVIGIFATGISSEPTWKLARLCVDGVQVAALSAVFLWAWFMDQPPRLLWPGDAGKHCGECVDQFIDYWKRLWLNWILLYSSYVVMGLDPNLEQQFGLTKYVFNNALQNLQSTMLLILFWTMIRPTLHVERNAYGLKKHHIPAWIACGVFALVEWMVLRRYQSNLAAAEMWPSLVTGIAAATCLGLFIGRLESRFLDVHPFELLLLYMYAGLQPLYRIFRLPNIQDLMSPERVYLLEFLIKALALALKLGLYFVVRRQLKSGRLAFYMWKVRVLHETVPRQWEAFEQERLPRQ